LAVTRLGVIAANRGATAAVIVLVPSIYGAARACRLVGRVASTGQG